MRCDPNPMGCKPCQDKDVPCRTTDRITGRASERGHTERLEAQIHMLKKQIERYSSRYGSMDGNEDLLNGGSAGHTGLHRCARIQHDLNLSHLQMGFAYNSAFRSELNQYLAQQKGSSNSTATRPREPQKRPIYGTKVDVMGATVDIANFYCPSMDDETSAEGGSKVVYSNSRSSFLSTSMGGPRPDKPEMSKQEAMGFIHTYIQAIGPFVGTLHAPSFMQLVWISPMPREHSKTAYPRISRFIVITKTHHLNLRYPTLSLFMPPSPSWLCKWLFVIQRRKVRLCENYQASPIITPLAFSRSFCVITPLPACKR